MNNYPMPEAVTKEADTKNGRMPETAGQEVAYLAGLDDLEKALAEESGLAAEMEALIDTYAAGQITYETITALYDGLVYYLDDPAIDFLLLLLTGAPDAESLDKVREKAAPDTWRWLRRLLARYGRPLQEAYAVSGVNKDGWRWLNRRVYYDTVIGRWGVSLELIKFNGEKIILEETPTSALSLAQGIVDSLITIPADIASELMDEALLAQFLDDCDRLREIYIPPAPEAAPEIQTAHIEG
jgi:hypothetical protein